MVGNDSLPCYVKGSLKTLALGMLQELLCLLSGTCFSHALPTPSVCEISLTSAPDTTVPIHAFQHTMGISAFFPFLFLCAIPGLLFLPRRAGHCLRQPPSLLSAPPQGIIPLPRAFTICLKIPRSPSLNSSH